MTKQSEAEVQAQVRLTLSQSLGCAMFRNNVGAFKAANGSWVRYGLANDSKAMNQQIKSADLIGWTPITIIPEMVGYTIPVFTSIEVKEEGYKPSGKRAIEHYEAQERWRDAVARAGGIAKIVDDPDKGLDAVREWLRKFDC